VGGGDDRGLEDAVTAARRLIALVVVAAGCYAFYIFCALPYRCNRIKKAYIRSTELAYNNMGTPEGSLQARQNLAALSACMGLPCRDVSLDMIAAANDRVLGRNDEAVNQYRHALRLDRRPELFANLAMAENAAGDRAAALKDALRAGLFSPWTVRSIEDGQLRQEVVRQLIALRPENADYIRYVDTVQLP
jgi:tetratricopeptide (TPR) repeat protein